MKRWFDLTDPKPWSKRPKKKITPADYMVDGWDSAPPGVHPYQRGSLHNKVGMWIMWTYYILFIAMVIRLIWVLNT